MTTQQDEGLKTIAEAYRTAIADHGQLSSDTDERRLRTVARGQLKQGHSPRLLAKVVTEMVGEGFGPAALNSFVRSASIKYPDGILCYQGPGRVNRRLIPAAHLEQCGCKYCRAAI